MKPWLVFLMASLLAYTVLLIDSLAQSCQVALDDGVPATGAITPCSREDFLSVQTKVQIVAKKVIRATVAITVCWSKRRATKRLRPTDRPVLA